MARRRSNIADQPIAAAQSPDHRKYEAREAIRTLQRAGEVMADRSLMREVKREMASQQKALAKITGSKTKKR